EVDRGEVAAPGGQRAGVEVVERAVAGLAHPVGLVLVARDRVDELVREPAARLVEVVLGDVEAVLDFVVRADRLDGVGLCPDRLGDYCSHSMLPSSMLDSGGSPWEAVAQEGPVRPSLNAVATRKKSWRLDGLKWTVSATGSMSPRGSLLDPSGPQKTKPLRGETLGRNCAKIHPGNTESVALTA